MWGIQAIEWTEEFQAQPFYVGWSAMQGFWKGISLSEPTDEFAENQLFHFNIRLLINDSKHTATQTTQSPVDIAMLYACDWCLKNRLLSHNFSAFFSPKNHKNDIY